MVDAMMSTSHLATAGTLGVLMLAAWTALGNPFEAVLAAAPVALLVPWSVRLAALDRGLVFPFCAAVIWLVWLSMDRPREKRLAEGVAFHALAALGGTIAVVFSPQSIVLLAAVTLYYAVKRGLCKALPLALTLVVIPAGYEFSTLAPSAFEQGRILDMSWWLDTTIGQGWDMAAWFQSVGGGTYRRVQTDMNMLFYLPLLVPFAAIAYECRSRWWFAPTFLWGGVLVGGNIVFAGNLYLQRSLALQMGLLLPFTIAALDRLRGEGTLGAHASSQPPAAARQH